MENSIDPRHIIAQYLNNNLMLDAGTWNFEPGTLNLEPGTIRFIMKNFFVTLLVSKRREWLIIFG